MKKSIPPDLHKLEAMDDVEVDVDSSEISLTCRCATCGEQVHIGAFDADDARSIAVAALIERINNGDFEPLDNDFRVDTTKLATAIQQTLITDQNMDVTDWVVEALCKQINIYEMQADIGYECNPGNPWPDDRI